MADILCRWRNSSVKQALEFSSLFPGHTVSKEEGRTIVENRWSTIGGSNFFTTPYQLAAQMGVYVEDNGKMYSRFSAPITIEEAKEYMNYWGRHYYAPNPYSRSLNYAQPPLILNNYLVNWVFDHDHPLLSEALAAAFSDSLGNLDILENMLNTFSDICIENDVMTLKPTAPTAKFNNTILNVKPDDKLEFYNYVGSFGAISDDTYGNCESKKYGYNKIFYGAPGTGKSHTIKDCTKGKNVIRTTFHPDSDYSTFVGAYKPTTKKVKLRDVSGHVVLEDGKEVAEDKIVYEFVEQAFLQAYINAWTKYAEAQDGEQPKEQYLIIEEINRGNCAQIFGDLFQLLDRNDAGFSDYPIKADNDMTKHLKKSLEKLEIKAKDSINGLYSEEYDDVVADVLEGKVLLLPNNLFIWATMNTSDQSLFPIDSAFKRRWEWKYIPISNADKGWVIEANGNRYDWWAFLEKINSVVCDTTSSEDKKLGYFFAKADGNGVISSDKFVGKVAFYLWNDVFKDYGLDNEVFRGDNEEPISFQKFFLDDGKANEMIVEKFLKNLGLNSIDNKPSDSPIGDDGNN